MSGTAVLTHGRRSIELSVRKKIAFAAIAVSFLCALAYAVWCIGWSYSVYRYVKEQKRGWRGAVHQPDAALGYAAIPGSRGEQTFAIGPDLPVQYDERGFRVPPDAQPPTSAAGPRILTLGCSFTFGDACPAEETFAERLGTNLQGTVLNAGKCSYGLAQMVLLARELIPRHKPDIVVAQFSPWLLDRSMTCYLPAYYGVIPGPYFAERGGELEIAPPVFGWDARDFGPYRETPTSLGDFVSFASTSAIPLRVHDDVGRTSTWVKQQLGVVPKPCHDRDRVTQAGYGELLQLCEQHQARMVIAVLGLGAEPIVVPDYLVTMDVPVAQAHEALLARLTNRDDETYRQAYANWRGDPPRMVDTHPNAHAHAIIADSIVEALRPADRETTATTKRTGTVR